MLDPAMLDYFYGDEAEQYTFYRIPKVLFTDPGYRRISSDAKILYGLMPDRMGLSVRNGWLDDLNRVFIYFTLEDALEYLCCGHTKAVSLFGEQDKNGLIERKKQDQAYRMASGGDVLDRIFGAFLTLIGTDRLPFCAYLL